MNILFVCSRNKWRSKTAETIFRNKAGYIVKSAGTDESARIKLTEKHLNWADIVFVMEDKHKERIREKFNSKTYNDKTYVLHISDDYNYMNAELIEAIETGVSHYLNCT